MKRFLKSYFTFSRSEKNGVIILLMIIIILLIIRVLLPNFINNHPIDLSEFEAQLDDFEKVLADQQTKSFKDFDDTISVRMFCFNPNTLDEDGWKRLGVKENQIRTIKNYVKKGGVFRKPDDLKKIYGLQESDYNKLKPYIYIDDHLDEDLENQVINVNSQIQNKVYETIKIELNSADSLELLSLKGIGPVFAGRIIRYRKLLGGYHNYKQLLEVYSFDSLKLETIMPNIYIDPDKIRKIGLNTADYKTLIQHPYLDKYNTKAILAYKTQAGVIKDLRELIDNKVIEKDLFEKIEPYFSLQ
ncbi:MAG: helix-hairpin-helix domain-containing protein [Bacteroidales bacterium]|nr:helix-hairpin-helix domain-containing protein [Bacteroidales bacterium]